MLYFDIPDASWKAMNYSLHKSLSVCVLLSREMVYTIPIG